MLLWLTHWARNLLWDPQGDCLWQCGAFPFCDFVLPRTGSFSVVYPGNLDSLCSSSGTSSSSAWALGLIWNGPKSLDPLAPHFVFVYFSFLSFKFIQLRHFYQFLSYVVVNCPKFYFIFFKKLKLINPINDWKIFSKIFL